MIGLPYGEKILPKSLTVCGGCTNVTGDRQTTDTIAVPLAEHNGYEKTDRAIVMKRSEMIWNGFIVFRFWHELLKIRIAGRVLLCLAVIVAGLV